ncbi:MAG TPA: hypothetical protein DIV40_05865 [Clostridiales bacterium]|nr:hypothetical protein [Clostridiales bacterium]
MKNKLLIIILIMLTVLTGCIDRNIHNTDNGYAPETEGDLHQGEVSSDNIVFDGDRIYYINKDSKLFSVKDDGTDKKTIFDKNPINSFQIYEDRIYMLHFDFSADNPSKLFYSNMDGTDSNELKLELEFSNKSYISDFVISNDLLYFVVYDFTKNYDVDFPKQFFVYNLEDGELTFLYEDIFDAFGKLVINDSILYSLEYGPMEYDILNKYNIETKEKGTININNNSHVENFITSKLYFEDDLIYYSGKTYIDVDNVNGLTDTQTLFEDVDFMIVTMAMTKEHIFFVNLDDLRKHDTDIEIMNLDIYRMNIDGSKINKIYTETMNNTNLPPGALSIVADDVIIYRNNLTDNIVAMDLDGNVLDWNL